MKKIKLQDLKVQSFVTSIEKAKASTIKAGDASQGPGCSNHNGCNTFANGGCDSAIDLCPTIFGQACQSINGTCAAETHNNFCL